MEQLCSGECRPESFKILSGGKGRSRRSSLALNTDYFTGVKVRSHMGLYSLLKGQILLEVDSKHLSR